MSEFLTYFQLGYRHISDVGAYDHILFIVALTIVFRIWHLKQILIQVTAFTIGHSITLALATLKLLLLPTNLIEFLIPVTIVLTALYNPLRANDSLQAPPAKPAFVLALLFGLVHGLGFSNYLCELLGHSASIWEPLLAFNVGLEIGQLLIVLLVQAISFLFLNVLKIKYRSWVLFFSGAVGGIAFLMALEKWPW